MSAQGCDAAYRHPTACIHPTAHPTGARHSTQIIFSVAQLKFRWSSLWNLGPQDRSCRQASCAHQADPINNLDTRRARALPSEVPTTALGWPCPSGPVLQLPSADCL